MFILDLTFINLSIFEVYTALYTLLYECNVSENVKFEM